MGSDHWNDLVPKDLLIDIVQRSSCPKDYCTFSAVCKSWNSAASEAAATLQDSVISQKPWWLLLRYRTTTPMLLLAEDIAPGSIIYDTQRDLNRVYDDEYDYYKKFEGYDYLKNSVGTSRGLYSLASGKTYNIELPEAAGRLILATSKGWLLTLGRDLEINLLHPLLRHQISLPSMLLFPLQSIITEEYTHEDDSERFIQKVAMSSASSPVVMVIFNELGLLGYARLGDKVWSRVYNPCSDGTEFSDIVYHRGNFYAVDFKGDVYVCYLDGERGRRPPVAIPIASIQDCHDEQKYLVEPLSGSGLLLVVRNDRNRIVKAGRSIRVSKYCTTQFKVWRLDPEYLDSHRPSCTVTQVNDLGNEAIFVGRASSLSVPSSDIIKPNSIYFTDDNWRSFTRVGGGHDMGIFNMEHRTVEPHYQGKSLHCISPPLWYI